MHTHTLIRMSEQTNIHEREHERFLLYSPIHFLIILVSFHSSICFLFCRCLRRGRRRRLSFIARLSCSFFVVVFARYTISFFSFSVCVVVNNNLSSWRFQCLWCAIVHVSRQWKWMVKQRFDGKQFFKIFIYIKNKCQTKRETIQMQRNATESKKVRNKGKNYEQKRAATTIKTSRMTYDTADVNS